MCKFAFVNLEGEQMLLYLQQMIQLILSPARGWEDVAARPMSGRAALMRGLLPLSALAGVTVLCQGFYAVHPKFSVLIPGMIVGFLRYFLTYYIAMAVMMSALPRLTADVKADEQKLTLFLSLSVGMMSVIGIIENLLPMTLIVVQYLPLYVAIVMYKGREFLGVRQNIAGGFVGLTVLSVIVPVFLIDYLLSKFI